MFDGRVRHAASCGEGAECGFGDLGCFSAADCCGTVERDEAFMLVEQGVESLVTGEKFDFAEGVEDDEGLESEGARVDGADVLPCVEELLFEGEKFGEGEKFCAHFGYAEHLSGFLNEFFVVVKTHDGILMGRFAD